MSKRKLTKQLVQQRFEEAVASFGEAKTACDLAIILGNEGAKGQCGNSRQCVMAQYLANKTGAICSVGGAEDIEFFASEADYRAASPILQVGYEDENGDEYKPFTNRLAEVIDGLISRFDNHDYKFLEGNMKGWHGQERKQK